MAKPKRPPKIANIMRLVHRHIEDGTYRDTFHSSNRQSQRNISRLEIEQVLCNGYHEKRKDEYQNQYQSWNYAIRGQTVDKRNLRVIVAFEENMLIITAIDLDN